MSNLEIIAESIKEILTTQTALAYPDATRTIQLIRYTIGYGLRCDIEFEGKFMHFANKHMTIFINITSVFCRSQILVYEDPNFIEDLTQAIQGWLHIITQKDEKPQ